MQVEELDEREEISGGSFLIGYLVLLGSGLALGFAGEAYLRIPVERTGCVYFGALFLLSGIGVPRRLYLVVRKTGWFALIQEPLAMRTLLAVLGTGLIALGIFASDVTLGVGVPSY